MYEANIKKSTKLAIELQELANKVSDAVVSIELTGTIKIEVYASPKNFDLHINITDKGFHVFGLDICEVYTGEKLELIHYVKNLIKLK